MATATTFRYATELYGSNKEQRDLAKGLSVTVVIGKPHEETFFHGSREDLTTVIERIWGGNCDPDSIPDHIASIKPVKFELHAQIGTGDRHVLNADQSEWLSPMDRLTQDHTRFNTRKEAQEAIANIVHGSDVENLTPEKVEVVEVVDMADLDAKALNDYYEGEIGYRPQEDDPTLGTEELRRLCEDVSAGQESE